MLEVDVTIARGAFRLEARFAAPTPGVVAVFGPSGAGKSTLVNAIAGLLSGVAGQVRLDGSTWLESAAHVDLPTERRGIGYVFQDARLFPHLDVRGNLRYGERRAPAASHFAVRDEIVALLGLEPLLSRRVHQLSGGERQRVALGRALLAQPRLLLLDEPLAAIDGARRDEVLPYLESLRDRFAIPMLYVSHQYDEVLRLATHIVLLAGGRVLASDTPARLSTDPRLRTLIGADAVGAVLDAEVAALDPASGLASIALGPGTLRFVLPGACVGARLRLHVLARDVMLAIRPPDGLSVRNAVPGILRELVDDGADAVLAGIDVDGTPRPRLSATRIGTALTDFSGRRPPASGAPATTQPARARAPRLPRATPPRAPASRPRGRARASS
jgi:molybdate transport system ATP-binding protein